MIADEAIKLVLDLARSEIGYHEKASYAQLNDKTANSGGSNWTKYAEYLDSFAGFYNGPKNGYPWCDVFVDFLFVKTFGEELGRKMLFQPMKSLGAGCLYSAQYYKDAGRWHRTSPKPGDQIFFSYSSGEYSHTGIVEEVTADTVTTIEGNTSDQVARRTYNIKDYGIVGYGTPDWKLVEDFVLVEHGQIVSTSEQQKEQEKPKTTLEKKENHSWRPGTLRPNDRYDVNTVILQGLLTARGFPCGEIDGYFGPLTEVAVNHAKRYYSFERNGEVDYAFWIKLLMIQR